MIKHAKIKEEIELKEIEMDKNVKKSINNLDNLKPNEFLLPAKSITIFKVKSYGDNVLLCSENKINENTFILEG